MDGSSGHMHLRGRVALIVKMFLSLLATTALSFSAAQAQKPRPPMLMTGTNPPRPSSIIYKETFSGFDIGTYYGVAGVWNTGSSARNELCSFQESNPTVAGGGKYLRCGPVAKDGANIFRTEYWYVGQPSFQAPTDLGNGHNISPTYWYGHKFCLDQYPEQGSGEGGGRSHFNQFHDVDDGEHSPKVSLFGNGQELRVYMEHNMEAPPINTGGYIGGSIISPVLYTEHLGNCINVIWQVRWDTRVSVANQYSTTGGSTGLVRLWLGASSTPVFEWVNRMTQHQMAPHVADGDFGVPYFNIGGYLSCWRNVAPNECVPEGSVYEARYDNFTVMDETGSWAAMTAEVNRPN